MLSFELSIIDIILVIEVTILLILYMRIDQSTKKKNPSKKPTGVALAEAVKLYFSRLSPNLASLILIACGSIILAWVFWLVWYDVTAWGKDIVLIFFSSRTGEAIGLGIGMKVFDYLLIGLALPLSGLFIFLRRRVSI